MLMAILWPWSTADRHDYGGAANSVFMNFTSVGRKIYALGGNRESPVASALVC